MPGEGQTLVFPKCCLRGEKCFKVPQFFHEISMASPGIWMVTFTSLRQPQLPRSSHLCFFSTSSVLMRVPSPNGNKNKPPGKPDMRDARATGNDTKAIHRPAFRHPSRFFSSWFALRVSRLIFCSDVVSPSLNVSCQ